MSQPIAPRRLKSMSPAKPGKMTWKPAPPELRQRFEVMLCAVSLLIGGLAGCGETPVEPTPVVQRTPPLHAPPPAWTDTTWKLTSTLTAITGPAVCFRLPSVGTSQTRDLEISRSGANIVVDELFGTVDGDEFTADANRGNTVNFPCGDTRTPNFPYEAHVSGRFLSNGRELTAELVASYQIAPGEVLRLHYAWVAVLRD